MFVFSPRSGTTAAKMENQISADVKKRRIMQLIALQNSITKDINKNKYLNNVFKVLCDGKMEKKQDIYCGRTECGRMVSFKGDENCMGKFIDIKITKTATSSLQGEIQI
jgi:tRNA-2-methylthio-N6-dimethylallyladenosine synthase